MGDNKHTVYDSLFNAFSKRFVSSHSKVAVQRMCNEKWAELKKNNKTIESLKVATEIEVKKLLAEAEKKSAGLRLFFAQASIPKPTSEKTPRNWNTSGNSAGERSELVDGPPKTVTLEGSDDAGPSTSKNKGRPLSITSDEDPDDPPPSSVPVSYPTPRQDALKTEIAIKESELNSLVTKRDLLNDNSLNLAINKLRQDISEKKKLLQNKKARAEKSKNLRKKRRDELNRLAEEHPEITSTLTIREKAGRPRVEDNQPGLLQAICDVVMQSGSADDRRRSEAIRACRTLDSLHQELINLGFSLSRSAAYLRLLPRNSSTLEGRRHVVTVSVKLCRAQSDLHRDHEDQHFCKASINSLEELASVLGPQQVFVLSQDDKSKVPIGMTAAKIQAPLLMHVEYKARLPDHDWIPGARHKLTPSVYGVMRVKEDLLGRKEAVTFSGPTYIAIRSGKHSSSTASSHAKDFEHLLTLPDFQPFVRSEDGKIKPVIFMSVDGGPDENPRYKNVIAHAIRHFMDHDLDAIFVFTNAPGRSAFNRVERRMAPLSRALSGVLLPHDRYGSHLDQSGKTIDTELELKNFEHAGTALAEIWSEMTIDGYNVTAEYVGSDEVLPEPRVSPTWYSNHVRESQYLLQVVKCEDRSCCSEHRSNLHNILFQRFLPGPFPLKQSSTGFVIPLPLEHTTEKFPPFLVSQTLTLRPEYSKTQEIPYDFYCSSVKEKVKERVCSLCGIYFASKTSLNNHRKGVHKADVTAGSSRVTPLKVLSRRPGELLCAFNLEDPCEWVDVESVDEPQEENSQEDILVENAPIIEDVGKWLSEGVPFEEDIHV